MSPLRTGLEEGTPEPACSGMSWSGTTALRGVGSPRRMDRRVGGQRFASACSSNPLSGAKATDLRTFRWGGPTLGCAGKYGAEEWDEYQEWVPYRIVPGLIEATHPALGCAEEGGVNGARSRAGGSDFGQELEATRSLSGLARGPAATMWEATPWVPYNSISRTASQKLVSRAISAFFSGSLKCMRRLR